MVFILGVILLVLGAVIARLETEGFREKEYAEFSSRSIQLASVFAKSAGAWLVRGNDATLKGAAGLMLAGSGQYVRITIHGDIVLDEQTSDPGISAIDLESYEDFRTRSTLRRGGLEAVVPIVLPGQGGIPVGIVQIGFSDTYAMAQVGSHRLIVFGAAAGSWFMFMLITIIAVRTINMKSRLSAAQSQEAHPDGIIRCGALEINTETCAVRLSGKNIEVTPKMFELLAYLARNAGKTFSDADLLTALWTDAPYAASGDVKQCIYMLRRRLSATCSDPKRIIVNVKGFGYKLEPPTEASLNGR